MTLNRREFIGAASAASLAFDRRFSRFTERSAAPSRPVVIASANGIRGVAKAYDMITKQNADTLDAIIAGVNIQELDPEDQSVGLGGLPNEEGVVQLDASCMHGPTRRAGAVAALEDIATPSLVAKAVMDYTEHVMLVGAGAKKFALEMGFKEQNLLTEKSRQDWLKWKSCLNGNDNWIDHADPVKIKFTTGTCPMFALNSAGEMSSVVTTSGLSWKIPGRVGDSAVIGAGQYCDQTVGAAGATGLGESCIKISGAFLLVELMRQGLSPEAACLKAQERMVAMTHKRWLDERGRPRYDMVFYALSKDGRFGSASLYSGFQFAVADATGARLVDSAYLFKSSERPASPAQVCRPA
ncbi:MAG TPA: N(4)-(beta-N-acetylglucosaminyl)-L-asparaginase [Gemmatimonadaceae bacterium]|jgi:N4-(beta-N-acetylglucosaminyl)-L-asparaginase|nr:N(4)-(beta-N-acetylglucosaminyl)-L-asparaginase [Gemmatimonadaceae bacterium]